VNAAEPLALAVGERRISALLLRPARARALFVLAHGAGAGMRHRFLEGFAAALAECGVATFRYQFPYAEAGSRRPDPRPLLQSTVRAAVAAAAERAGGLPLLAGGKSMGGRMTSLAAAEARLGAVRGLVFVGFPLHPAGRPGTERAAHLAQGAQPMLFLQGSRDRLADLGLLEPIVRALGPRAELEVVPEGDHSFGVPRRTARSQAGVLRGLAEAVGRFAARVAGAP
jgi:predicted alpha/beta-hydrolase family hydrolase